MFTHTPHNIKVASIVALVTDPGNETIYSLGMGAGSLLVQGSMCEEMLKTSNKQTRKKFFNTKTDTIASI